MNRRQIGNSPEGLDHSLAKCGLREFGIDDQDTRLRSPRPLIDSRAGVTSANASQVAAND